VDALFATLAKKGKIEDAALSKKLVALGLKEEPAELVVQRVAGGGMTLRVFLSFVQVYYTVQKPSAITDKFDVTDSGTKRKVEKGEVLELLEGPVKDEAKSVERIRARAVLDGESGWVSISGNQGTAFLTISKKAWYYCRKGMGLDKAANGEGGAVRELMDGEIVELIQGPHKEVIPDLVRAKVKAPKDNVQGWITIQDRSGTAFAEANAKLFVCKSAVVLTDSFDIATSKMLRKLNVGETIETETGEATLDAESGVHRIKGKATKDGKEGWVTTKGNAGTVFAEVQKKNYTVVRDVELTKEFKENAEVVRKLEVGEAVEVLEGPRTDSMPAVSRIQVRSMTDKATGWVTDKPDFVKLWNPVYKCHVQMPINDTRGATEVTKTLRELGKGELFEYIDGPFEEEKELRMKGKAKKDGVVGWVTLKTEAGKRQLEC